MIRLAVILSLRIVLTSLGYEGAQMKSSKHHLTQTKIKTTINSRPISPVPPDPSDLILFTPGHFLIGKRLTSLSDSIVTHTAEQRLTRFQKIQQLHRHFWQRWAKEYIGELQQHTKWRIAQFRKKWKKFKIL